MYTFTLSRRRIAAWLVGALTFVFLASLPAPVIRFTLGDDHVNRWLLHFEHTFALNREANVPTWFVTVLLLLCAITLAVIGRVQRARGERYSRHWTVLALIFLYISIDEAAVLHEKLNVIVPMFFDAGVQYAWVVIGGLAVVMGIAYFSRFVLALPTLERRMIVLAGLLFVGGALGLEIVEGYLHARDPSFPASALNFVLTHIEEMMEKTGLVIFLLALLSYIDRHIGPILITFQRPPTAFGNDASVTLPANAGYPAVGSKVEV